MTGIKLDDPSVGDDAKAVMNAIYDRFAEIVNLSPGRGTRRAFEELRAKGFVRVVRTKDFNGEDGFLLEVKGVHY